MNEEQYTEKAFADAQAGNSIINKLRALFRLADPKRGATPEEADTAMRKAQELMTRHGIAMASLGDDSSEGKAQQWDFAKEEYRTGRQRYEQDRYIYWILERCFGVKALFSSYGEYVASPKGGRSYVKRHSFILMGDKTDIAVAKLAIEFLHPTMRSSYLGFCKATSRKFSVADAHCHYRGIMDGYINASEQGKALARQRAKKADADAYAIVLVDKDKALCAFVAKTIGKTKKGCSTRANNGARCSYESGYSKGSSMTVATGGSLK